METTSKTHTFYDLIRAYSAGVVITIIIALITLGATIVSIAVSNKSFNHRYDASAKCAQGLKFTFSNDNRTLQGTVVLTAGKMDYGYFQNSGDLPTCYEMKIKKK